MKESLFEQLFLIVLYFTQFLFLMARLEPDMDAFKNKQTVISMLIIYDIASLLQTCKLIKQRNSLIKQEVTDR